MHLSLRLLLLDGSDPCIIGLDTQVLNTIHAPRFVAPRFVASEGDGDLRQDDHLGCRDLCAQQPRTLSAKDGSGSRSVKGGVPKVMISSGRRARPSFASSRAWPTQNRTRSAAARMTTQLGRGEGGDGRGWRMSRMRRWILSGRPPPSRTRGPCLSSGPCRRPGQSAQPPRTLSQAQSCVLIAWLCLRLRRAPCLAGSARCSRPGASAASTSAPQPPQQAVSTAPRGRA